MDWGTYSEPSYLLSLALTEVIIAPRRSLHHQVVSSPSLSYASVSEFLRSIGPQQGREEPLESLQDPSTVGQLVAGLLDTSSFDHLDCQRAWEEVQTLVAEADQVSH